MTTTIHDDGDTSPTTGVVFFWVIVSVVISLVMFLLVGLMICMLMRLSRVEAVLRRARGLAGRATKQTTGVISAAGGAAARFATETIGASHQHPPQGVMPDSSVPCRVREPEVIRSFEEEEEEGAMRVFDPPDESQTQPGDPAYAQQHQQQPASNTLEDSVRGIDRLMPSSAAAAQPQSRPISGHSEAASRRPPPPPLFQHRMNGYNHRSDQPESHVPAASTDTASRPAYQPPTILRRSKPRQHLAFRKPTGSRHPPFRVPSRSKSASPQLQKGSGGTKRVYAPSHSTAEGHPPRYLPFRPSWVPQPHSRDPPKAEAEEPSAQSKRHDL